MRMSRDGNSFVTTPLYVGSSRDVVSAALCTHDFRPSGDPTKANEKAHVQMERCKNCCAVRARIIPVPGVELEDLA